MSKPPENHQPIPDDDDDASYRSDEAQAALAAVDGVLELLERQSEQSEACFNAYCLLALVRGQLGRVLESTIGPA